MSDTLKEQISASALPQHVAIIMDGNGRWAKKKGYLRAVGHENGVDALRRIATAAAEIGIRYLTVYAFSSENWNRPRSEVNALMSLLVSSLRKELKTLQENNIRLKSIGRTERLPKACQKELQEVMTLTEYHHHMDLILALSYGSHEEILDAVRSISHKAKTGEIDPETIDAELLEKHLYTSDMPHPDLLIRTSGEQRISNYLLWQLAYSELYFSPRLWPEFSKEDFYQALLDYQQRERRYGKISEQIKIS